MEQHFGQKSVLCLCTGVSTCFRSTFIVSGWTAQRAPGSSDLSSYQGAAGSAEAERCGSGRRL